MKKILFLAAMLSFLAIYSCQDNAVPENNKEENTENSTDDGAEDGTENGSDEGTEGDTDDGSTPVTVEGSYTIGDRSGEITSAYYGISSKGECRFFLVPDGLAYTRLPPFELFYLDISFPEQTPKLQPGTYTTSDDGGIKEAGFAEVTESNEQMLIFESANAELSETGDYYTLTLSGTCGDDIVSVTYTGPFFELDYETSSVLGSGSYSIGNFSSSLGYAYADLVEYDESSDRTKLDLYICSVPENVNGTNEINRFNFDLWFPGRVSELQPGTYQETDDIINQSRCSYYDEAGDYHSSIDFKTLTLEISKEGTDYKIKATGTLIDESKVSVDFSGYVTYGRY